MQRISANQLARELSPHTLQLIILPTEKCNFRCTYCYEDFEVGKMSPATRMALKHFISRRLPGISHLGVSWFGGEPLLAIDVMEDISLYAIGECEVQGAKYEADITTNAFRLDRKVFDHLMDLRVNRFQISLDGDEAGHDHTRRLANGGGTFGPIWENLQMMRESTHQFSATLRLHLTPDNLASMESLVGRIAETFGADPRFHVLFKAIERLGGAADARMETLEPARAVETASRLRAVLEAAGTRSTSANGRSESDTRLDAGSEPYVCYAARPNSLVVRADGTLSKCTVMLNDARNSIGRLRPDGTIEVNSERFALWVRGFGTLDEGELGCPAVALPKFPVEQPVVFHSGT